MHPLSHRRNLSEVWGIHTVGTLFHADETTCLNTDNGDSTNNCAALKGPGIKEDYKLLQSNNFNKLDKMDIFPERCKIIKFI